MRTVYEVGKRSTLGALNIQVHYYYHYTAAAASLFLNCWLGRHLFYY